MDSFLCLCSHLLSHFLSYQNTTLGWHSELHSVKEKQFSRTKGFIIISLNSAIKKTRKVPRCEALNMESKEIASKRPVFAIQYDPGLLSIPAILKINWMTMTQDPRLKETFPVPPLHSWPTRGTLMGLQCPKCFKTTRRILGMKKCNGCGAWPFVRESMIVQATSTNWVIPTKPLGKKLTFPKTLQTLFISYLTYMMIAECSFWPF